MAKRDYYQVLGVSRSGSADEIRKAHRKLVRQYHPDVNKNNASATEKFKEIQELSSDELQTKKRELRQESLHLRLQQQSGQLEQPSRLRLLRRQVAQLETVLAERAQKAGSK